MDQELLQRAADCGLFHNQHKVVAMCARCQRVRDNRGAWKALGAWVHELPFGALTHGLCQDCAVILYGEEIASNLYNQD